MKQVFYLVHREARKRAVDAVLSAPDGYRVEIREKTRSLEQNDLMWSRLTDIAKQVLFVVNGQATKLTPEEVKDIMSASLKKELKMAIGLHGEMVILGQRTSKMTVKEMSDLIELVQAFGAENDVKWSLP